MYNRIWRL